MSIEQDTKGNYWLEYKPGRFRAVIRESDLWHQIEAGQTVSTADRPQAAVGTFTPVIYFRNQDGTIGIPPSPESPIPSTAIRCEARTLSEVDAVTREMNIHDAQRFHDNDEFRENFSQAMFGTDPRSDLRTRLANSRSNKERDVIRMMLHESEESSRSARSFTGHSSFHFRDYDR